VEEKMKKQKTILNLLALLCLCVVAPVEAENQALMELLKALQKNGTIDEQTYELVKNVAKSESENEKKMVQEITREEVSYSVDKAVDEATDKAVKEQFELASKELAKQEKEKSENSIRIGGRIQFDATAYNGDIAGHSDGTEIRRARLFAQGKLGTAWGYKLQYDFADDIVIDGLRDAYLDFNGFESFKIRIGHTKEAFSLQNMTSSKYVLFTERALPIVFTRGRNLGLEVSHSDKNWSAAVGLFGRGVNGAELDNDEGFGVSSRVTYAPINEQNRVLHLGATAAYRSTGSIDALRFRVRPESHQTNARLVDTGFFDADSYNRFVGEAAFITGPFHVQGEYYYTSVDRDISTNPDLDFSGFYVEGGWFLTGESMNYKPSSGIYSRVTPKGIVGKGGIGAWQVALRFSSLDLTDEDISGGEEDNFTLGLNWYATPNIRFTANYVNVLDVEGGSNDGDEPESFQIRSQVEF
jgi:phosphate-selective porin OprO/OprP